MLTGILGSQVWRVIAQTQREDYDAGGWELECYMQWLFIIPISSLLALLGNIPQVKSSPLRIWTVSSQAIMGGGYLVYCFITLIS